MKIIEVEALPNFGHRNQTGEFDNIPRGYAVIPDDLETPNFPFGEFETQKIDGVLTVINWTPHDMPEQEEVPDPISIDERVSALENAMLELILGGNE